MTSELARLQSENSCLESRTRILGKALELKTDLDGDNLPASYTPSYKSLDDQL